MKYLLAHKLAAVLAIAVLVRLVVLIGFSSIFAFEQTGIDDQGLAMGDFHACGIQPRCQERLRAAGIHLPPQLFERRVLRTDRMDDLGVARPPK